MEETNIDLDNIENIPTTSDNIINYKRRVPIFRQSSNRQLTKLEKIEQDIKEAKDHLDNLKEVQDINEKIIEYNNNSNNEQINIKELEKKLEDMPDEYQEMNTDIINEDIKRTEGVLNNLIDKLPESPKKWDLVRFKYINSKKHISDIIQEVKKQREEDIRKKEEQMKIREINEAKAENYQIIKSKNSMIPIMVIGIFIFVLALIIVINHFTKESFEVNSQKINLIKLFIIGGIIYYLIKW